MNAVMESISMWMQLHPMGLYCTAGATLLGLLASNIFILHAPLDDPFPKIDMSIPDLIRVYEEETLHQYSTEQLGELQKMADGCAAVFAGSALPQEAHIHMKLIDISTRITGIITRRYGLDGMTRINQLHA